MAKKIKEMEYCSLRNMCDNKYLCCHFCSNKKCEFRCMDDHKKCDYKTDLIDEPVVSQVKPRSIEEIVAENQQNKRKSKRRK